MKSGDILAALKRHARRVKRPALPLPPGFDAAQYCAMNPDVAAAFPVPEDAAQHYAQHGRAELRRVFPEGVGLDHPESRMLRSPEARRDWIEWLRAKAPGDKIDALVLSHPRALWLQGGFVLSAYLHARRDVAAQIDTPMQGAFHFLEFGIEEGEALFPEDADTRHLKRQYGSLFDDLSEKSSPNVISVLLRLFDAGHDWRDIALTEPACWEVEGFCGDLLMTWFDPDFYHATAQRAGLSPATDKRLDCLQHFCRKGASAGLLPHPDLVVEPRFYIEHWLQVRASQLREKDPTLNVATAESAALALLAEDLGTGPDQIADLRSGKVAAEPKLCHHIMLHFLSKGGRIGAMANIALWAQRYFGQMLPPELATRLMAISFTGTEVTHPLDKLSRMMAQPMLHLEQLPLLTPSEAESLLDKADNMALANQSDDAEWLYRTVIEQYPSNERGLNHLADLMRRLGRLGAEYQLRQQSLAIPGQKKAGGVWNLLALAEMAFHRDAPEKAMEYLRTVRDSLAGDEAIRSKFHSLTERLFNHVWSRIGEYADRTDIPTAQAFLREVLDLATPTRHGPIPDGMRPVRHVALVGNVDLYQCKLYRVDQKAEQLRAAGFEVSIFHPFDEIDQFRARLPEIDAAIFFRLPAFPSIMAAITACAAHGVPTFYEIDDLVFDADLFPPALETYAGKITRIQHRDIACGVPLYAHALSLCDYAIGSTRVLAEQMAPHVRSRRAFEHHNALGSLHLNAMATQAVLPPRGADRPLVLFYGSGTLAHKDDFHNILEPALAKVLQRYKGKVEVQLVGSFSDFKHLDPQRDALRFMPPVWDFEQYCLMVAGADINLSVLSPGLVTDTKSEIKWLEAAMFGIPSVLSRTATHEDVVEHGKTGFLCDTAEDFVRHISALIENPDLRRQVGEAANSHALDHYSLNALGTNLREIVTQARPTRSERKPRLLVVNVFYPPQALGGATRVVRDNITDLLAEHGDRFDIHVACSIEGAPAYNLQAWTEEGVPVWGIGTPDQGGTEMIARDPKMEPIFGSLLDRVQPDLVHFHCIQRLTSTIVDATRKRDIPYIITLHDGWWISDRQFLLNPETDQLETYDFAALTDPEASPRARALWPALKGARGLYAVSEAFAQVHRDCNLPDVRACENGVSHLPEVTRLPHPEGRVRLAHLGGTERHKGLHLLRAVLLGQDFKNLELLVIDHAMKPGLIEQDIWGTTPVIRRGKVPQGAVTDLYAGIDVLVAPSVWPEAYGLVTREALATGAWVIASDRGGTGTDVVEDVNGHVINVAGPAALAQVLRRIDAEPERYQSPPKDAPPVRSARAQVQELVAIYAEILNLNEPEEHPDLAETQETGAA
ncbi:MAG: glycosyltransferase [Roseinatronobacter sp.]